MEFNRKCLLLVTCIVASMIKSSVGECASTLRNTVLTEGQSLTFNAGDNQKCFWYVAPSSETFNIKKNVSKEDGTLEQMYGSSYSLDGNSLVMNYAKTEPGQSPYATAGIYICESPDNDCITAAKVVVIQSGPTCSCAYDPDSHSTRFTVTIVYADTAKNDMYPMFNCTLKGKPVHSDMPLPERTDKFRFSATTVYERNGRSLGALTEFVCTVTFDKPAKWPVPNVDQRAPDYAASCNFEKTCN